MESARDNEAIHRPRPTKAHTLEIKKNKLKSKLFCHKIEYIEWLDRFCQSGLMNIDGKYISRYAQQGHRYILKGVPWYMKYEFIRNGVKVQLVPFLIFPEILDNF